MHPILSTAFTRPWRLRSGVLILLTVAASAQASESEVTRGILLQGFVTRSGGLPAAVARVLLAGRSTTWTDREGFWELCVDPATVPDELVVTVIEHGGLAGRATTRVRLAGREGSIWVEPLALTSASSCEARWIPTFGEAAGVVEGCYAALEFDDGSGPALFVGSRTIEGDPRLHGARRQGGEWFPLGLPSRVFDFCVYDSGGGDSLYAAGEFGLARWEGDGFAPVPGDRVRELSCLTVFDDGSGPKLYAGGRFVKSGGLIGFRIGRWDGEEWTVFGYGINGTIQALDVFDDGTGSSLYVGGWFDRVFFSTAAYLARWDPIHGWREVAGPIGPVRALETFDDGNGPALFIGGQFVANGALQVAKWDGTSSRVIGAFDDPRNLWDALHDFVVYAEGAAPSLFVGGRFTEVDGQAAAGIARWTGTSWQPVGGGIEMRSSPPIDRVESLAVFDDGNGPELIASGFIREAGAALTRNIARWNGIRWAPIGTGLNGAVSTAVEFDDGRGPALFLGGEFDHADGIAVNHIARWDGSTWSTCGLGLDDGGNAQAVTALTIYDDGRGDALYACGQFVRAGGQIAFGVARWDGSTWESLRTTYAAQQTNALAVFDDGGGPQLYLGGSTTVADPRANVMRWNGTTWESIGMGAPVVLAFEVFDDGTGAALYALGFDRDGDHLARWDGSSWTPIAGFDLPRGYALAAYDDGNGAKLYVGGQFDRIGGVSTPNIAAWDGAVWSALPPVAGNLQTNSLAVFDFGDGPKLYVGGLFRFVDASHSQDLLRWDGTSWSSVGSLRSLEGESYYGNVNALAAFDSGQGPALIAGGDFWCPESGDAFLARWDAPPDLAAPRILVPRSVEVRDTGTPGEVVHFEVNASDTCDNAPVLTCTPPSGSLFPRGATIVTCTATDSAGNRATAQFPVHVLAARSR